MELTLQTVKVFIEEILQSRDSEGMIQSKESFTPINDKILLIVGLFDNREEHYHIDGKTIWRKSIWNKCQEKLEKDRIASELYNRNVFLRKEAHAELTGAILSKINIPQDLAVDMASAIIKSKEINGANYFGVDISNLPELGKRHIIIMEGGKTSEL